MRSFEQISREVFAPIYPVIAQQIIDRCGIKQGICIDIGSGPGSLGMAISTLLNGQVYALDICREMTLLAIKDIPAIQADVHRLPFKDEIADLIISRGSVYFWEDVAEAFKQIERVLKPGGCAYIGGGFGTKELRDSIMKKMDFEQDVQKRLSMHLICNIPHIQDESGSWYLLKKEEK